MDSTPDAELIHRPAVGTSGALGRSWAGTGTTLGCSPASGARLQEDRPGRPGAGAFLGPPDFSGFRGQSGRRWPPGSGRSWPGVLEPTPPLPRAQGRDVRLERERRELDRSSQAFDRRLADPGRRRASWRSAGARRSCWPTPSAACRAAARASSCGTWKLPSPVARGGRRRGAEAVGAGGGPAAGGGGG
jgi:hypothetical protein